MSFGPGNATSGTIKSHQESSSCMSDSADTPKSPQPATSSWSTSINVRAATATRSTSLLAQPLRLSSLANQTSLQIMKDTWRINLKKTGWFRMSEMISNVTCCVDSCCMRILGASRVQSKQLSESAALLATWCPDKLPKLRCRRGPIQPLKCHFKCACELCIYSHWQNVECFRS